MHKPVERLKSEVTVEGRPTVILVGADKGGVGKTIVARSLLDYFATNKVPARAFDTEAISVTSSPNVAFASSTVSKF